MKFEVPDQLLDAIAERLAAKLRDVVKAPPAPAALQYVSRREARSMGIELRALLRAERDGSLPAFKPGRHVVYRRGDLEVLVERARVATHPALLPDNVEPLDVFERARVRAAARKREGRYGP
jgi:hypothetical protein